MKLRILACVIPAIVAITGFAAAQVGTKKSGDPRVEKLLKEAEVKFKVDNDGDFALANETGEGRTQLGWILSKTSTLGSLEIREVWSIGYRSKTPLSAEIANRLLEMNASVKLGAWQVRKMGNEWVAVFSAQIAAETDRTTLLIAVHAVTTTADKLEKELVGTDEL